MRTTSPHAEWHGSEKTVIGVGLDVATPLTLAESIAISVEIPHLDCRPPLVQAPKCNVKAETLWPRSWIFSVRSQCLHYHHKYSHTKGARKYYNFSDDERLCSLCVKLEIDFEEAVEMGLYDLISVVYERFRELRVPAQTGGSRFAAV